MYVNITHLSISAVILTFIPHISLNVCISILIIVQATQCKDAYLYLSSSYILLSSLLQTRCRKINPLFRLLLGIAYGYEKQKCLDSNTWRRHGAKATEIMLKEVLKVKFSNHLCLWLSVEVYACVCTCKIGIIQREIT